MDALLVEVKLVGGDIVRRHQILVGVARSAQVWHVRWINRGTWVIWLKYLVTTVTVSTGGYIEITFGQAQPVDTFFIFGKLIGRQVVLAHPGYIGVATGAQGGYISFGRRAYVTSLGRHGLIHRIG